MVGNGKTQAVWNLEKSAKADNPFQPLRVKTRKGLILSKSSTQNPLVVEGYKIPGIIARFYEGGLL